MVKAFYKHKILFDENMPDRSYFPNLNKHFNVKHVSYDINKAGVSDHKVYLLAVAQNRILVTFNWKDFLEFLGTADDAGVIGIAGSDWPKIDTKLTALLKRRSPKSLAKKYTPLMGEQQRTKH